MHEIAPMTRLRYQQIRVLSKTFEALSFHRITRKMFEALGKKPGFAHLLVGFRRKFSSFDEALQCTKRYDLPSHDHPANATTQHLFSERARTSDYPVLFHLRRLLGELRHVLDIGGSAGNLFYCYARYLEYPQDLRWTVFEVPQNVATGRRIAAEREERRIEFIDDLRMCARADTVVISGSLHYFEELPPQLMHYLDHPPKHVFINRTPVIDGPSAVTVQDAEWYYAMSPARILSRQALMESMAAANYELVDEWMVPDLRLRIPLAPGSSVSAYSGFYFRARAQPPL